MQMNLFPLDEKKKIELIKHTAAIHIKTNLSLVDRKVLNVLLKNANDEIGKVKYHTIRLAEIKNLIGWEGKNYVKLKTSLRKLVNTKIEWNILGRDKKNQWCISALLASASIAGGKCTYDYPFHLQELLKNPNIYGRINLITQNNFKSKYSLILWEFLMNQMANERNSTGTEWIKIKEYRDLMGIEDDQYSSFKEFSYNLVRVPIKDINKISEIEAEAKYQKTGGSVSAIRFIVTRKEKKELIEAEPTSIEEQLLNYCKLSKTAINEIIQKYSPEQLKANIKYIESADKKGLIKSIGSYSFNAIKNDFRLGNDDEQKRTEQEEPEEISKLREKLKKLFTQNQLDYDIYLNGNEIKKIRNGFLVTVSKSGEKILKSKYIKILEQLKINLELNQ